MRFSESQFDQIKKKKKKKSNKGLVMDLKKLSDTNDRRQKLLMYWLKNGKGNLWLW